jgi:hypothetical protein
VLSGVAGAVGAVGADVTVCAVGVRAVGFGVGAISSLVGVVAQPVLVLFTTVGDVCIGSECCCLWLIVSHTHCLSLSVTFSLWVRD